MGGLIVEKLHAGYRHRDVIAGMDLPALPDGALVALLGANAAGKSTLLKGIAGLIRARGRIELDGQDLTRLHHAERLHDIGYLPQALPQSSSLIVYETLLAAARAARAEHGQAMAEAAIEQALDMLSLRELALRRLDELSGGQRQMVGLAQVVVRQPRLLLLDEPTSALDLRWQLKVLQTVRHLTRDRGAICMVAIHDLNLALRYSDRVIVLSQGRVLAAGEPATVMTSDVLHAAYGIQGRVETCSHGYPIVLADHAA
ncbi:MAG: ABC transporter ATP-binding protein [Rhodocyclaceae bacterium]